MDNKVTSLIINAGVVILAIIGVYLIVVAMGNDAVIDPVTGQESTDTTTVSRAVSFSLWVVYATIGAIALFTIMAIVSNPKRFIPTAIGIAVFGVLVLIGYAMVVEEPVGGSVRSLADATEDNMLWGGIGIKTTYVLVIVAIGLIIAQGVRSLIGYFK